MTFAEPGLLGGTRGARLLVWSLGVLLLVALALVVLAVLGSRSQPIEVVHLPPGAQDEVDAAALAARRVLAERRLRAHEPRGVHLVVDSYSGRLRVLRGDEVLKDATCSAGSGAVLRDPRNGRIWVFETPLGERRVERKVRDPVWVKPDWAFIEEGYEPPPLGHRDRFDTFSLGDYALYLGDGYIIHGTTFQTLLGRRVTHGCVRLGDDDLRFVYEKVPLGARVYLY
jgi:L,D-transpeptidase YbiS